jgi:hypothetical protein
MDRVDEQLAAKELHSTKMLRHMIPGWLKEKAVGPFGLSTSYMDGILDAVDDILLPAARKTALQFTWRRHLISAAHTRTFQVAEIDDQACLNVYKFVESLLDAYLTVLHKINEDKGCLIWPDVVVRGARKREPASRTIVLWIADNDHAHTQDHTIYHVLARFLESTSKLDLLDLDVLDAEDRKELLRLLPDEKAAESEDAVARVLAIAKMVIDYIEQPDEARAVRWTSRKRKRPASDDDGPDAKASESGAQSATEAEAARILAEGSLNLDAAKHILGRARDWITLSMPRGALAAPAAAQ